MLQKPADLRVRRHVASVPNGHVTPKCHGMQEVRGSNPLSSTPGQRPCSVRTPTDSPASGSKSAAAGLCRVSEEWIELSMRVRLPSLILQDDSRIDLADPGITVIVGPNNSGKTLVLREIITCVEVLEPGPGQLKILSALEINKEGSADDLLTWLEQQGLAYPNDPRTSFQTSYRRFAQPLPESSVREIWNGSRILFRLRDLLVAYHPTESRLQLVGGASVPDLYKPPDNQPLQILYGDRAVMEELSGLVERAFGTKLTLNRYGSSLQLHMGVPSEPETLPPPSRPYLDALLRLPLLHEQGDGVRSFVGLLLHTMAEIPIVLIDEPEAFLHPPQARLLGRLLVERAPKDGQLIVATHSDDILQGILEVRDRPVRVIRLTRNGDMAVMQSLDPDAVRELWRDPLIRYSQLLDGLFHDAVLICESDSDCRFYSAVFDDLIGASYGPAVLMTHCGGKERLPKAVRAVTQFGVRTGVIADLDLLADSDLLADLIGALRGHWTAYEKDYKIVSSAVADLAVSPEVSSVREQLHRLLDGKGGRLDAATAKAAKRLLGVRSGWQEIKLGGLARLPAGDASRAARSLLDGIAGLGLFLVPVGELERWVTVIGGHGPEWLSKVLEGNRHLPLTEDLKNFGRRILSYCTGP